MAKTKKTYVNLVGGSTTAKPGRKRKRLAKSRARKGGAGQIKGRTTARSSR